MRSGERGAALILVLILLAVGSVTIVPNLNLGSTILKSKQITTDVLMEQYARDGAGEFALWEIQYGTVTSQLTTEGQEAYYQITLNGVTPDVTIKLVAQPQQGGVTLATDDVIRPTKTVTPNAHPFNPQGITYTYSINLTQTSTDTSQGLDAVYDILPKDFFACADPPLSYYVIGSSFLDGVPIPDPACDDISAFEPILRWPATGSFPSPIRDFSDAQVKVLTFQYHGRLQNNRTHCNWVVLKPWNTLSGRQAPITVGAPQGADCEEHESLNISKTADPQIIPPGVETVVTYTVVITNTGDEGVDVERVIDYLPPGFTYCGPPDPAPPPPAGGTTHADCQMPTGEITLHPSSLALETVNGADRWKVRWDCQTDLNCTGSGDPNEIDLAVGETRSFTFTAKTILEFSGDYHNEVLLLTDMNSQTAFQAVGLTDADFGGGVFSWNTGTVNVPGYDIRSNGGSAIAQGNAVLVTTGVLLNSWNVENQ